MDELAAAEIVVVSLNVRSRLALDRFLFAFAQDHSQRFHDRLRDVVLNLEYVLYLAIIPLRPQMISIGDIHQLGCDSQLVAELSHAAFEHCRDFQFSSYLTDVLVLSLECKRGRA